MKVLSLLFVLIFVSSLSFAQKTLRPEIAYEGPGRVILNDGTVQTGVIRHSRLQPSLVIWMKSGSKAAASLTINQIKEFYIGELHFFRMYRHGYKIPEFAKWLTDSKATIRVYELCHQENTTTPNTDQWLTQTQYWVEFPGQRKPRLVGEGKLTASNVSDLVKRCPSLSERIRSRAEGYRFGVLVSEEISRDAFLRISGDYEVCVSQSIENDDTASRNDP